MTRSISRPPSARLSVWMSSSAMSCHILFLASIQAHYAQSSIHLLYNIHPEY